MPANRKYFRHGDVLLVTSRTEEGLPLVPSHNLNFIIWGILAKAKSMYRVKICHFLFMANHFHMILVVDTPEDVSAFVGYIKGEIAHAVNILLGRKQKTIWRKGYDSPILLEYPDVEKYIEYIYLNPVKANLVNSISEYPGVSSWEMFSTEHYSTKHKKLRRTDLTALPFPALSVNEQKEITDSYKLLKRKSYELTIEPFACLKNQLHLKEVLIKRIKEKEAKLKEARKIQACNSTALRRQSMLKEYVPRKYSRRMICLSANKELRRAFVEHFKSLCTQAQKVYQAWLAGDFSKLLPPGLFYPPMRSLCSELII